jgi:hypothetical protein
MPLSLKMIYNVTDNLEIDLFEGLDSFVNLALAVKFDQLFSLLRSGLRVWEKPEG